MNYFDVISSDGYRIEDLTPQNQESISWCRYLVDNFKDTFAANHCTHFESDTILGRIEREFVEEIAGEAGRWLESTLAEIQVSMADNQPEEAE